MGRHRTGSIRQRGAASFEVRFSLMGRTTSETFTTRDAAERRLRRLQALHAADQLGGLERALGLTLGEALGIYVEEVTPQKSHAKREANRIRYFIKTEAELCATPLGKVHTSDIKAFVRRRKLVAAQRSVNLDLAFISHLFSYAIQEWEMDDLINPVVRGVRLKEPSGRDRLMTDEECARLLVEAEKAERHPNSEIKIAKVIRFAASSAVRQGELGRLTWADVDLNQGIVRLQKTKNGSKRDVPLTDEALSVLVGMVKREDSQLVFGGSGDAIRCAWSRVRERAGVSGLRFHDLRHHATTLLFETTNLTDMEVSQITGHKTLSQLKRYAHIRARTIVNKLRASRRQEIVMTVEQFAAALALANSGAMPTQSKAIQFSSSQRD